MILVLSGTGKAVNFNFCTHIHRIDRNKSSLKLSGKYSRGRAQGLSKIFRARIYRVHCAVIFAVAQRSCLVYHCMSGTTTDSIEIATPNLDIFDHDELGKSVSK